MFEELSRVCFPCSDDGELHPLRLEACSRLFNWSGVKESKEFEPGSGRYLDKIGN